MGFGFAGAGAGAAKALEEILGEQMLRAQMQQREQQAAQQMEMERARFAEVQKQNEIENTRTARLDDERAADRRSRNNVVGVRRMIGDSLMQRTGPMTPEDRRSLAAMQVEAGDLPDMSLLSEPPKKMRSVTVPGPKGQPINRMVPEDEAVEEYREPKSGPAAPKTPLWVKQADGTIVDINKVAPPGSRPIDAVADRQQATVDDNNKRAVDAMRAFGDDMLSVIDTLIDEQGNLKPEVAGVIGGLGGARPEWAYMSEGSQGALANIDRLQSMLNIDTLRDMKSQSRTGATGFGALSELELNVVESSASKLRRRRQGDADYAAELKRLRDTIKAGRQVAPTRTGSDLSDVTLQFNPATGKLEQVKKS